MTVQHIDQPNSAWCTTAQVLALAQYAGLSTADPALIDFYCLVASTWLWRASGRQFSGQATDTVWPEQTSIGWPARVPNPQDWFNSRSGTFGFYSQQGRGELAFEVLLGHTPVRSVDEVTIDGTVLSSGAYRLDDSRWLRRCDGQAWPLFQDWTKPDGTWKVTLTFGEDPPPDGIYAAEVLAGELALAGTDTGACRLPNRVQSVTRQGTSMLMVDPQALIKGGRWGVAEIDMFVDSVNPNNLQQQASVTSPDIGRAVRRVGTNPDYLTWQDGDPISWEQ